MCLSARRRFLEESKLNLAFKDETICEYRRGDSKTFQAEILSKERYTQRILSKDLEEIPVFPFYCGIILNTQEIEKKQASINK